MRFWIFPLPLSAVLCMLLISATLPATTQARGLVNRPSVNSEQVPIPPSQVVEPAVLPDGPVDESIESLLGDTSKLQLTAEVASAVAQGRVSLPVAQKFQAWARKFGKKYSGAAETVKRMLVFAANLAFIEAHNLKHPDTRLKLNEFSDMSFKEFKAAYVAQRNGRFNLHHWLAHNGGTAAPAFPANASSAGASNGAAAGNGSTSSKPGRLGAAVTQMPSTFDWITRGVVTPARNQGYCRK